jgi:hypothetical protein
MSGTPVESIVGAIDACRPEHEVGDVHGDPIVLPSDRVTVRGWALARDGAPISVSIVAGERSYPVERTVARPDVAGIGPLATCGFEVTVDIEPPSSGNAVTLTLHVAADGRRTSPAQCRVVAARTLVPSAEPPPASTTPHGRFRTIADADPRDPRHGWAGRRTMRWNSAIVVRGWILDAGGRPPARVWLAVSGHGSEHRVEAALVGDGEATAVAGGGEWFPAGFVCAIAPWALRPGLYFISAIAATADGTLARGPIEAFQVVEDDDWEPPLFLPVGALRSPEPAAEIGPVDVVRGDPVVVRGCALEPGSGRGSDVFVRFDAGRPLPIPTVPGDPSRFGGIADTAILEPGLHRLQVLLQPAYPGYWHLIDERQVLVRARPLRVSPDGEEMIEHG